MSRLLASYGIPVPPPRPREPFMHQQEKTMKHLLQGLPVGAMVCDREGTIVEGNEVLHSIFGYEPGELIGRNLSILLPESVRFLHAGMMERFFQKPEHKLMDGGRTLPGVRKDGRKVLLNIGLSYRQTEEGVQAVASVLDVTSRWEAEKKSEQYQRMLEEIRELLLLHLQDPEGQEIYYRMLSVFLEHTNSPLGFIGEVEDERLRIRAITDITWDETSSRWLRGVEQGESTFDRMDSLYGKALRMGEPLIANQGSADPRSAGILPPGHTPIHRFLAVPLMYRGKVIALAAAANADEPYEEEQLRELRALNEAMSSIIAGRADHRKKMLARKQIQAQERRFRSLVENARDLIGVFDLNNRLVYATPAQKEVLGFTDEDLSGLDAAQFIHPDDQERMHRILTSLKNEEEVPSEVRYRYRHKDGSYRVLEGVFRLDRDIADEPLIVVNARDITELEYYQSSLLRTVASLQSESAAKNRFLAKLSHEIRTPLNAILGLTDLLLRERMDQEHEQLLKVIHNSGDTLLRLLNDLLEATQLETEELNLRMEPLALRDTLEHTLLAYQYNARQNNRSLDFEMEEDVPSRAIGDAGRIKQIVTNLVSNAIKYTPGGHIRVRVATVPSLQEGRIRIRIAVCDTGPGIPEQERQNIFRIFSRIHRKDADITPGVGLGLYIVQQITQKMGGTVDVVSPSQVLREEFPNCVGTDFAVELELHRAAETPSPVEEEIPARLWFEEKPRVLVAEDNPSNQILMERMLQDMNCEAVLVSDGHLATKIAAAEQFDLIIVDINMPGLNGFEAARIIRAGHTDVPIIALSAAAEDPGEERLHAAGMSLYLVKPVWQPDLYRTIRDLTGKR